MNSGIKKLNRFTTIPFLIDLLKRKKLTLLNPGLWEDYNDRETMEVYRRKIKAESIYALCLTHQSETIHHWNAFASGSGGCCIELSPAKLFAILEKNKDITHGKTEYVRIKDLSDFEPAKLPYFKRHPFEPEKEYRIIATSDKKQEAVFDIDIDLDIIRRITISNKVPKSIFDSIEDVLLQINPAHKIKISHSTLYNNPAWKNHFRNQP